MAKIKIPIKDGQVFGYWTVLNQAGTRGVNDYFECECSCGTVREVFRGSLIGGKSRSCGCKNLGKPK